MSMFNKLGDAISANVNDAIESKVSPDKMARYYADKAHKELDVTRNRIISIMADRKALEREVQRNEEDIKTLSAYAEKAMQAGNKDDARKFLEAKKAVSDKLADNQRALEMAKQSEATTLEAYDAHAKEVAAMESDIHEIKANVATAEARTAVVQYPSGMSNRATTMFRKMKLHSRRMIDEANASREIAEKEAPVAIEAIKAKYDMPVDVVAEEMAALEQKYS